MAGGWMVDCWALFSRIFVACFAYSYADPFVFVQAKKANFDASHELEELLLEDNPLKAKARKANQDNLSDEMKQMEDQ
jgi:hypothetical protein